MSTLPIIQSAYGLTGTGQQIGGVSAGTTAQVQATLAQVEANRAAAAAAAAERAATPGVGTGAGPGPIVLSTGIPNNFFGFVMIALGMR